MKRFFILAAALLAAPSLFAEESKWFMGKTDKAVLKSISATSELVEGQYDGKYVYPPINILDGDLSTVWCEADEKGSGIGEAITIEFEEPVSFDEIQIVNGFAHKDYYRKNNRFAEIQLTQVAKEHFQQKTYALADDTQDYQSIKFGLTQTAQTLTIKLTKIYKGTKYDDTCLGDIRFLYKGKAIPLENVEEIKNAQVENSKLLLAKDDFKGKFRSLLKKDRNGNFLPLFLLSDKGRAKIILISTYEGLPYISSIYDRDYHMKKPEELKEIYPYLGVGEDYDPKKHREIWFSWERYYRNSPDYDLGNHRIIKTEYIDYVEVKTNILLKISGNDFYMNGVHYTVQDPETIYFIKYSEW